MPEHRGCMLLDTPLDLMASIEMLIQNYELVRQNILNICPTLPPHCSIIVFSGHTAHNQDKVPLMGVCIPDDVPDSEFPDIQADIDRWFESTNDDTLNRMRQNLDCVSWKELLNS